MKGKILKCLRAILVVSFLSLCSGHVANAASKDLVAAKRNIYQDNNTENMRDVYARREEENKEYRQKVLLNGEESVRLLREIRDVLRQMNAKKQDVDY